MGNQKSIAGGSNTAMKGSKIDTNAMLKRTPSLLCDHKLTVTSGVAPTETPLQISPSDSDLGRALLLPDRSTPRDPRLLLLHGSPPAAAAPHMLVDS